MFHGEYESDQASRMRDSRLKDQFGRLWHVVIDKTTGQPTGHPSPIEWIDPLETPNTYLTVPKWDDGSPRTDELMVDFVGWIADVEVGMAHWNMAIRVMGEKMFPLASSDERDGWTTNPHLTREAGPMPKPTVETLKKAMNGDQKLLGLDTLPKTRTTDLTKLNYREFVQLHAGLKLTITDIAERWNVHKANLAEADGVDEVKEPVMAKVETYGDEGD